MTGGTERKAVKSSTPSGVLPFLFFPLFFLSYEMLLRLLARDIVFFEKDLIQISFFSAAAGLLVSLVIYLIPRKKIRMAIGSIVAVMSFVICGIEFCCMDFYGMYFGIGYMTNMTGQVVGGFLDTIGEVVSARIPQILILLIPVVIWFVFMSKIAGIKRPSGKTTVFLVFVFAVLQASGVLFSLVNFRELYTYDFESNAAIKTFGVGNAMRLELVYDVFGMPQKELPEAGNEGEPLFTSFTEVTEASEVTEVTESAKETEETVKDHSEPAGTTAAATPTPYPYNMLDIDFEGLYNESTDNDIKSLHLFFGNNKPTRQNKYTGIFKDKNLILITAEAFCPYAVDKDYTPTLYRLSHESFVFTNFYQPNWHMSTTGGEYAVMTGQIPQFIGANNSFVASSHVSMPLVPGNIFRSMGYSTPAWHNGAYTYYNRDKTHPNLGYDFSAINHGLDVKTLEWPASDKEMFEATCDSYIEDYVKTGQKFHAYYMTVSGHCNYSWGANAMSKRHKESAIEAFPDSSMQVQAYKAANKDLDLGLEYLLKRLEEEGIADDTVIVMAADHYPYGIANGSKDYYKELSGIDDTEQDISRYKNTLVIWCGALKTSLVVDTPSSTVDIVPTILNMFGIAYDSRLYPGRDIFADNYSADECSSDMPLVILPMNAGNSWVTAAGSYDVKTKTFVPDPGITVADDYVDQVNDLVRNKWRYSGLAIKKDYYSYITGVEKTS